MIINWLSLFAEFSPATVLLFALAMALAFAGAAILPDWDYKNSTISTAFGPLSQWVHKGVVQLHFIVADLTKQGGDRKPPGAHRGVSHWWPTPLVVGGLTAWGCWWSHWFLFGTLVVLYTGAIRALTVPDYMPKPNHSPRRRWSMQATHGILDLTPGSIITLSTIGLAGTWLASKWFLFAVLVVMVLVIPIHYLKKARKHVNRTHVIHLTYWHKLSIPIGKIGTVFTAAILAFIVTRQPFVVSHGAWVGVIVCLGMFLHMLGDYPTEMGGPGLTLYRFWKLPKWLAFKAGSPFEIALWVLMSVLAIYLLPGVRPHNEVLVVQEYIAWGLGATITLAVIIEATSRHTRKRMVRG